MEIICNRCNKNIKSGVINCPNCNAILCEDCIKQSAMLCPHCMTDIFFNS